MKNFVFELKLHIMINSQGNNFLIPKQHWNLVASQIHSYPINFPITKRVVSNHPIYSFYSKIRFEWLENAAATGCKACVLWYLVDKKVFSSAVIILLVELGCEEYPSE